MNNILLFKKTSSKSGLWLGCKPKAPLQERHSLSYNIILPDRKKLRHECEADQRMLNHQNLMGFHRRASKRSRRMHCKTPEKDNRNEKYPSTRQHTTQHPRRQGQNLMIFFAPKVQSNTKCTSVLTENIKTTVIDKSAYRQVQENSAKTPVRRKCSHHQKIKPKNQNTIKVIKSSSTACLQVLESNRFLIDTYRIITEVVRLLYRENAV